MFKEKIKAVLRIIFPIIFISYTCSITFFTHTHIVNGVTIVHSHPYLTDENGNPDHEHSGAEIQLIHFLTTYFAVGLPIVLSIIWGLLQAKRIVFCVRIYLFIPSTDLEGLSLLRPPPSL